MLDQLGSWGFFRPLTWGHVLVVLAIFAIARLLAALLENAYQPGDWIDLGGTYGEVKAITLRSVRLLTADDTAVIIPHSRIWSTSVANATGGSRSLLCVTRFYLHPDHDAPAVCHALAEVAATSAPRKPSSSTSVVVAEQPWGTEYKLKAYVDESREQFAFTTDLTIRGKAALQALGVRCTNTPYAATGSH